MCVRFASAAGLTSSKFTVPHARSQAMLRQRMGRLRWCGAIDGGVLAEAATARLHYAHAPARVTWSAPAAPLAFASARSSLSPFQVISQPQP
jgi:hypothetical protein